MRAYCFQLKPDEFSEVQHQFRSFTTTDALRDRVRMNFATTDLLVVDACMSSRLENLRLDVFPREELLH